MRIRTVKPEFWFDEKTGQMSLEAVVVFLALLNMADDHGNLRADTRLIRGQLFPYRPTLDIDGAITECVGLGLLRPYEVRGQTYINISNFLKHQKINRPSAGKLLPQPQEGQFTEAVNQNKQTENEGSLSPNGGLTEDSLSHHGGLSVGREGKGRERKGKEIARNDEKQQKLVADATVGKGKQKQAISQMAEAYRELRGSDYLFQGGKDGMALKELLGFASEQEVLSRWRRGLLGSGWLQVSTIAQLRQKWNDLAGPAKPANMAAPKEPPKTVQDALRAYEQKAPMVWGPAEEKRDSGPHNALETISGEGT